MLLRIGYNRDTRNIGPSMRLPFGTHGDVSQIIRQSNHSSVKSFVSQIIRQSNHSSVKSFVSQIIRQSNHSSVSLGISCLAWESHCLLYWL
jgi:hypothetical protein